MMKKMTTACGPGWTIKVVAAFALIVFLLVLGNQLDLLERESERDLKKGRKEKETNIVSTSTSSIKDFPMPKYSTKDPFEISNERVFASKEYQLEFNPRDWIDREEGLRRYMEKINLFYGLNITRDNGLESVRIESNYVSAECGRGRVVRVRDYVWGHLANESTVDIKVVSQEGKEGIDRRIKDFDPTSPSVKYTKGAIQKLEQDMHPCKDFKWSRETRITNIPFLFTPKTCSDVVDIWPNAFTPNYIPESKASRPVIKDKLIKSWWVLTHSGRFPNGNKFKSAFTLAYTSTAAAIAGKSKPSTNGEWSLRVWADDDGFGSWDQDFLAWIWKGYVSLLDIFGSGHEWPCPEDLKAAKPENVV